MKTIMDYITGWRDEIVKKTDPFKRVTDFIESAECRATALFSCAAFLYHSLDDFEDPFYKQAHKFFSKYGLELMELCLYAQKLPPDARLKIEHPEILVEKTVEMIQAGCLQDHSFETIANYLNMIFHTGYKSTTLKKKLWEKHNEKK